MQIELINTGSELLLGRVLNTHQQWIGRRLADLGYEVARQIAVPDTGDAIRQAVAEALSRSDLIITTGGLGPTSDDRTRDLIAELLNRSLTENIDVMRHITGFFKRRNRPMPDSVKVQALIPEGAKVLMNQCGMAPGLAMTDSSFGNKKRFLLMLPGPPSELRPMFDQQALPWLQDDVFRPVGFACRTLRSTGIGESRVEEQLRERLDHLVEQGLEIGYCARKGEVDVRIIARGDGAEALVAKAIDATRELFGRSIYGEDDDCLEEVIVRILTDAGKTLTVAESCTGGYLAHRLTNVPGASKVFDSGLVTYSNEAKMRLLGVLSKTLEEHGAVSEATAGEMADGARQKAGTDYAISVTGIAGPTGGTAEKPVGTAFIGVATRESTTVLKCFNPVERESFKHMTSQQAFEMLRRELLRGGG
ncbi:MAG: Nicotinamide-nucleotide amidohydrolase PncC [Verrucomicrobia subdivision 3 bacterium]|nr:Nicotinamide-nucleotide amidohydrolase PncC [Limisphaerales bacterium]MCS1417502.1 Nicotinamide-nucleotide amidohydrolase PncC [Limisphaerales bacterium]